MSSPPCRSLIWARERNSRRGPEHVAPGVYPRSTTFPVIIGEGSHPFPFRTRKLSPPPPMVLQGKPCGRVGHCRDFPSARRLASSGFFSFQGRFDLTKAVAFQLEEEVGPAESTSNRQNASTDRIVKIGEGQGESVGQAGIRRMRPVWQAFRRPGRKWLVASGCAMVARLRPETTCPHRREETRKPRTVLRTLNDAAGCAQSTVAAVPPAVAVPQTVILFRVTKAISQTVPSTRFVHTNTFRTQASSSAMATYKGRSGRTCRYVP